VVALEHVNSNGLDLVLVDVKPLAKLDNSTNVENIEKLI
jgi:hypothetical protein